MAILDNAENSNIFGEDKKELPFSWNPQGCMPHQNSEFSWDEEWQSESSGLIKIYSDTCCNGCSCKASNDHKPE